MAIRLVKTGLLHGIPDPNLAIPGYYTIMSAQDFVRAQDPEGQQYFVCDCELRDPPIAFWELWRIEFDAYVCPKNPRGERVANSTPVRIAKP